MKRGFIAGAIGTAITAQRPSRSSPIINIFSLGWNSEKAKTPQQDYHRKAREQQPIIMCFVCNEENRLMIRNRFRGKLIHGDILFYRNSIFITCSNLNPREPFSNASIRVLRAYLFCPISLSVSICLTLVRLYFTGVRSLRADSHHYTD